MVLEGIVDNKGPSEFHIRLFNPDEEDINKKIIHATDMSHEIVNDENLADIIPKVAKLYQREVTVHIVEKPGYLELEGIEGKDKDGNKIIIREPDGKIDKDSKPIKGYILDSFAYGTPKKLLRDTGFDTRLPFA